MALFSKCSFTLSVDTKSYVSSFLTSMIPLHKLTGNVTAVAKIQFHFSFTPAWLSTIKPKMSSGTLPTKFRINKNYYL